MRLFVFTSASVSPCPGIVTSQCDGKRRPVLKADGPTGSKQTGPIGAGDQDTVALDSYGARQKPLSAVRERVGTAPAVAAGESAAVGNSSGPGSGSGTAGIAGSQGTAADRRSAGVAIRSAQNERAGTGLGESSLSVSVCSAAEKITSAQRDGVSGGESDGSVPTKEQTLTKALPVCRDARTSTTDGLANTGENRVNKVQGCILADKCRSADTGSAAAKAADARLRATVTAAETGRFRRLPLRSGRRRHRHHRTRRCHRRYHYKNRPHHRRRSRRRPR